jgi:hypothetical protein
MRGAKLKVKIIKVKSDMLWYRHRIGETYDVKDEGPHKNYYVAKIKGNAEQIIYKEDTEEL